MQFIEIDTSTILMVDDHEENLKVLAGILSPHGFKLIPAMTGEQAFERLENRVPDLILLDVILPDLNGVEVCRRIKENKKWKNVPVIFLSAADDKGIVVEALESGGVDYITKPFNQAELLSRVRTHLALKIARDKLTILAADKDQLLRVMAHDFKNQISGVQMSTKLLLDREECQALPERSLKLIRNVSESSERMMGFMKSFLANQGTRNQTLKVRTLDPEELIEAAVMEVEPAALMKKTKITRGEATEGWAAMADANASRQVFENLIENAVKFCPPGSEVKVSSRVVDGRKVEITISDNGPGFTEGDREKMFKRYSRLSARPSGGEPSSGLGLYIAKGLMEDMGGSIRLEDSKPGACFVLTFRAQPLAETTKGGEG